MEPSTSLLNTTRWSNLAYNISHPNCTFANMQLCLFLGNEIISFLKYKKLTSQEVSFLYYYRVGLSHSVGGQVITGMISSCTGVIEISLTTTAVLSPLEYR